MGPASDATERSDLARAFAELNVQLGEAGDRDAALQRLVELAVRSVPGCDWAAVTAWPQSTGPRSLASSDPVAAEADRWQYALGEGPCLTATGDVEAVVVPDLTASDRWPRYATAVVRELPVRGVMSFHLADVPARSALNLYGGEPDAFDGHAVSVGALFAAHARVLMVHVASVDKATNLTLALNTSRQIGAAIGILMNVHKITEAEAFALLRVTSQNLNRKLREVAVEVTETGTIPTSRHR